MNQRKRVVIYARVSSEEQKKGGFSTSAQLKLLRDYGVKNDYEIVGEYEDTETAKVTGRTRFNEMVKFLQKEGQSQRENRCRTVLVEKTDRLYRNLKDYIVAEDLEIEIHFVKEGVVLSPESHSSEKLMHLIKVGMAKAYVENLGEEIKKGMHEKAAQGIWPCQAPAGYRNVTLASGKKGIEPDPDTAPIVTKLFEWYTTGNYSLAEIADLATDNGLKFGRSRNLAATVHNLFKNPIYYGDFLFTGKMYQGIHTPLVTRELWDRVQEVRKDRGTRKPKRSKHSFAFSNLIQCRHCGCSLVAELKKQKYIYYHCTGYKGKCEEPYVREEVLEEQFGEVIRSLKFDPETLDWVTSALKESHQDEKRFHDDAIQRLQSEYSRLQNRIDQMYVDKLDRRVTDEFFDQKSAEWRQEQQGILHNLEQHQNANQSYLQEGVAILELANRAAELFEKQSASEKRRLLDFVLSNSSWGDGELTVEFRQPFDLIAVAAMELKQKKAAGVDSDDLHQFKYTREGYRATWQWLEPIGRGWKNQTLMEDVGRCCHLLPNHAA